MASSVIFIELFLVHGIFCYESDSLEINGIDFTPFYDTVIFSDVADIINEFENNANSPLNTLVNSESESGEDIEDLLLEYQHYLDKAHKQRKDYLETKTKNKVPMLRHDKYVKPVSVATKQNYYGSNSMKHAQSHFPNTLDFFRPFNTKVKYMNTEFTTNPTSTGLETANPKLDFTVNNNNKKVLDFPFPFYKSTGIPSMSSCFCKNKKLPCECDCKQCLLPFNIEIMLNNKNLKYNQQLYQKRAPFQQNELIKDIISKKSDYSTERFHGMTDNTLNIGIKLNIQLPKTQECTDQCVNNSRERTLERGDSNSKEYITSNINLPLPFFNIPIPMDLFRYKKPYSNKIQSPPVNKIMIHKKKKSRMNNNNKKHRKNVITFHKIKLEPQKSLTQILEESCKLNSNNTKSFNISQLFYNTTQNIPTERTQLKDMILNETNILSQKKRNETDDTIYLMLNITSNTDNVTDDFHKNENSIETDFSKKKYITTEKSISLRKRREVIQTDAALGQNQFNLDVVSKTTKDNIDKVKVLQFLKDHKKINKSMLVDSDLLYWPSNPKTSSIITSKNITTIILDRENKKAKLNISRETIRNNRTRALEKAIFGNVDWDDIDTVAPVFMSFVGKYIKGILTFCSKAICHSMKCAEKTCVHRICVPAERWNQKGHCAGSNDTDSIASMESIMDLPSNIAFEIVDILEEKMLGKLFGKVTLCINMKCISFAVSKKNFVKGKCSLKEVNTLGHCPSNKVI